MSGCSLVSSPMAYAADQPIVAAFATARSWSNDFCIGILDGEHRLAFGLVEQCQLRGVGLNRLLGFTTEYTVA
ncbi:hypothetical protein J2X84_000768 [Pseudomonas corrugata]|nr:hypothetical protein [Pseudomonas corrugata]